MDLVLACNLGPSGLSRAAQEFYRCFRRFGIHVIPSFLSKPQTIGVEKLISESMISSSKIQPNEFLQFYVAIPQAPRSLKGSSGLAINAVFEGHTLSSDQYRGISQFQMITVPSHFCLRGCLSSGFNRKLVNYLPYPLDTERWNPKVNALLPKSNRFRFLYMNSMYERKGFDCLLDAWWGEFSKDDPVELVFKSYIERTRMESTASIIRKLADQKGYDPELAAPIYTIDQVIPDEDLPSFMKSFDAFVSPHRSEGFGMNPWYSMALGVPVIATDYGGTQDFCFTDTSWPVNIENMTRPSANETAIFPQFRDMVWAEPDVVELGRQMRECLEQDKERQKRAAAGAKFLADEFSFNKIMSMFEQYLQNNFPSAWEKLCSVRIIEEKASHPAPKYETHEKPIEMVEI